MKVLAYGVREVELPIFEQVNEKFGYELNRKSIRIHGKLG